MFSFAGDTVLDPFAGTGSTGMAAITAGRNSIGVEIDPSYVETAARNLRKAVASRSKTGAFRAEYREPPGEEGLRT